MMKRRSTSKRELDEIIEYWLGLPRGSHFYVEGSLIQFLYLFTPGQIKGAMYVACSEGRANYFKYLCGILHNWRRQLEKGEEPNYFDV